MIIHLLFQLFEDSCTKGELVDLLGIWRFYNNYHPVTGHPSLLDTTLPGQNLLSQSLCHGMSLHLVVYYTFDTDQA